MPTSPKFILINGSASKNCAVNKLETGIEFVRSLTKQVIEAGHGVAMLAAQEPLLENQGRKLPLTFDWEVLRSIDNHIANTSGKAERHVARVFMRTDAIQTKISEENVRLIKKNAILRSTRDNSHRIRLIQRRRIQGPASGVHPCNGCDKRRGRNVSSSRKNAGERKTRHADGYSTRSGQRRRKRGDTAPVRNER